VTGVDILPSMIDRAMERAASEGVESLVEFKVADACELPFDDGFFDVVLCESVFTFIEDKEKAAHQLTRVLKPGGYAGLNEEYWIKHPSDRIAADVKSIWDIQADIPTLDSWLEIFNNAGLQDCMAIPYRFNSRREATQVKRYRPIDMWKMFTRTITLFIKYPDFRAYMRNHGRLPKKIFEYLGYALFTGRK
jgi:ubiquinone/menaquinone biosynthesis C-methylase UbiE